MNTSRATEEGLIGLGLAAYHGQHSMCKLLVNNGAEVNGKDKFGRTALHYAVFTNKVSPSAMARFRCPSMRYVR